MPTVGQVTVLDGYPVIYVMMGAFHLPRNFGHFGKNQMERSVSVRSDRLGRHFSGLPFEVVHFDRSDGIYVSSDIPRYFALVCQDSSDVFQRAA